MKAYLALEDGTVFTGRSFGAPKESWGEVVFNTSMTGYQEILTDPVCSGQIVVMTYPLVGNYGINRDGYEAVGSFVQGLVVREACDAPGNWRAGYPMEDFLIRENVPGICGIDTRALTRHLRSQGTMTGVIAAGEVNTAELVEKAKSCSGLKVRDLVAKAAVKEPHVIESLGKGIGKRVVLVDLGAKQNLISKLQERNCTIIVVPPDTTFEAAGFNPDGVIVGDGPGDPRDIPDLILNVRWMLGRYPIFGVGLGQQVLALGLGAQTSKMKFGHRGSNYPVKDLRTGRIYITSHNHGFSVDAASLSGLDIEVSHINLNDGTVEGIRHRHLPLFGVQYQPEAYLGSREADYVFDQFMDLMSGEVK